MAVTNNKWQTIIATAASDTLAGQIVVDHVNWEGITAAGQDLIINDKDGNNVVTAKSGADSIQLIPIPESKRYWNGFTVATMTSGRVVLVLR